mmetsp:Transcript_90934/g.257550  ORF Transcript_90934/g.257550 Transcript_90934/m.257550 type:complete len:204 (+) Transcript_90934:614-1225(+)
MGLSGSCRARCSESISGLPLPPVPGGFAPPPSPLPRASFGVAGCRQPRWSSLHGLEPRPTTGNEADVPAPPPCAAPTSGCARLRSARMGRRDRHHDGEGAPHGLPGPSSTSRTLACEACEGVHTPAARPARHPSLSSRLTSRTSVLFLSLPALPLPRGQGPDVCARGLAASSAGADGSHWCGRACDERATETMDAYTKPSPTK